MASGQHLQVQAAGDAQLVSVAAGDAGVEYFHYADPGEGVGGAMQGTLQEGPQGQVQIEWTYRGVPTNVPVLVENEAGGEGNMEQVWTINQFHTIRNSINDHSSPMTGPSGVGGRRW